MDVKKILVPIDFSDHSMNALNYAINFAQKFNAEIVVINVLEFIHSPVEIELLASPAIIDETVMERTKQELENIAKKFSEKIKISTVLKIGRPFIEINETALELDVDLIIIATHGHTGISHLLFGSTAEKVVRKSPCPVLSVRNPIKGFKYNKN